MVFKIVFGYSISSKISVLSEFPDEINLNWNRSSNFNFIRLILYWEVVKLFQLRYVPGKSFLR